MLLVVAIVSKLIGCGLGARICHFTGQECIQVGTGMACRGEVALIVANHAVSMGVLSRGMMTPVIITVIGCAILTPIMLKFVFRNAPVSEMHESTLVDRISETEQLDIVGEQLLEENKALMSRSKKEETAPENK
jgi:Kef-type K+ transport system membrane component KefB